MRPLLSGIATLLIGAGAGAGCSDGGSGPGSGVLTTVEVTPASPTLFTVAPGNTVVLAVVAKDQDGGVMSGAGAPTFSSANDAVANVGTDGTVTAAGAGTTEITASVTAGGVSKSGTTTISVEVAGASKSVIAPEFEFQPATVDVSAGGTVTWSFEGIHHTVTFTTAGAPEDVPLLQDGSATRTFPNNGVFEYRCSIHTSMAGVVRVH
jgi:plastocyanin